MAKRTGGTRATGSSSASASRATAVKGTILGGGKGVARGNEFSGDAKITDFDGSSTLGGGEFSMTTKNGEYTMVIETNNFIENGEGWTLVSMGVREGTGRVTNLTNDNVETGPVYTESMGAVYHEQEAVAKYINNVMPYFAERANYWIKNRV